MDRAPKIISALAATIKWPLPRPDGSTVIDTQVLRQLQALVAVMTNFIETQLTKCSLPVDAK